MSRHSVCNTILPLCPNGGVYIQSGVTLIETDCKVFAIDCTCPTLIISLFLVCANKLSSITWFAYHQPNKLMAYLTFHKWLVSGCNIHNNRDMNGTNQNQSLGKNEILYYFIRLTIFSIGFYVENIRSD